MPPADVQNEVDETEVPKRPKPPPLQSPQVEPLAVPFAFVPVHALGAENDPVSVVLIAALRFPSVKSAREVAMTVVSSTRRYSASVMRSLASVVESDSHAVQVPEPEAGLAAVDLQAGELVLVIAVELQRR